MKGEEVAILLGLGVIAFAVIVSITTKGKPKTEQEQVLQQYYEEPIRGRGGGSRHLLM